MLPECFSLSIPLSREIFPVFKFPSKDSPHTLLSRAANPASRAPTQHVHILFTTSSHLLITLTTNHKVFA